jgi:hypothetical protein
MEYLSEPTDIAYSYAGTSYPVLRSPQIQILYKKKQSITAPSTFRMNVHYLSSGQAFISFLHQSQCLRGVRTVRSSTCGGHQHDTAGSALQIHTTPFPLSPPGLYDQEGRGRNRHRTGLHRVTQSVFSHVNLNVQL